MYAEQIDEFMCAIGFQHPPERLNGKPMCGMMRCRIHELLGEKFLDQFGVRMADEWVFRINMAARVDSIIGKSRWITNTHTACSQAIYATLHRIHTHEEVHPPLEHQGWVFPTPEQEQQWRDHHHRCEMVRLTNIRLGKHSQYYDRSKESTDDKDNS